MSIESSADPGILSLSLVKRSSLDGAHIGTASLGKAHVRPPCAASHGLTVAAASSQSSLVTHTLLEGTRIMSVAAGRDHTVLLVEDATHVRSAVALGSNKRGQLGANDRSINSYRLRSTTLDELAGDERHRSIVRIDATWTSTLIVARTEDQLYEIWMCGSLGPGAASTQLRRVDLPETLSEPSLACGSEHVLALVDATVYVWGWNEHGNLGLGHQDDVPVPTRLVDLPGRPIAVAAGNATSWIAVAH